MFQKLFSPTELPSTNTFLAALRILVGGLMIFHGYEVFDSKLMTDYAAWDSTKGLPAPVFMVSLGKGIEFLSGICLVLGLGTRLAGLFLAVVMFFICFKVGGGKFWYDDQHPFLLGLFGLLFFFVGPVKWNLDSKIF